MRSEPPPRMLDYASARRVRTWTRALRTPEFAGLVLAVGGFLTAWMGGRGDVALAHVGVVVMLTGFLLYAAARVWQRSGMSRWARAQLLAATILSVAGVLNVMDT